jgi:hypothetical protein
LLVILVCFGVYISLLYHNVLTLAWFGRAAQREAFNGPTNSGNWVKKCSG